MTDLSTLLQTLERLAPLRLAGSWDNVGLLVEGTRPIAKILLCIDLTEPVLAEALERDVDTIVAYHPPLFRGVTRLGSAVATQRVLLGAIRAGVHVYSPHSALDAAADGMTDWLVRAVGPVTDVRPVTPDSADPTVGAGRSATLLEPALVEALIPKIKTHLGLHAVRMAAPPGPERPIRTVAVCPGAGESVLERVRVDLVLTGEMRHHDVVAHVAAGRAVVLTDHTHTERGYLPIFAQRLSESLPGLQVACSTVDADPLSVR